MRVLKRIGLFAVVLVTTLSRPVFSQACAPATDSVSVILLGHMRHIASSTVPRDTAARVANKIPSAAPSTVTVVTQNQTCQKALAGFIAAYPLLSPVPTRVSVVKVGTVYVVSFALADAEGWPHAVLDSKYAVLSKFVL